jgi:hypothetical protein
VLSCKLPLPGALLPTTCRIYGALLLLFASTPSLGLVICWPVKTYVLLERITQQLATVPPDAAARYSYCWTQASELAEVLLDDLEAVLALRGYVQDMRLLLYPKGNFSEGKFFLGLCFDPQDQFSVLCSCWIGEPGI